MIGTTTVTLSVLESRVLEWTKMRLEEVIGTSGPYSLCYIDRGDQLSAEQIQQYVADDFEALDESTWEWIADQQDDGAVEIVKDFLRDIQRGDGDVLVRWLIHHDYIKQYSEEENEAVTILMGLDYLDVDKDDELRQQVKEMDESDPIKELAQHTNHVLFRTTLIDGESGWTQGEEGIEEIATALVELGKGTLTISDATDMARDLTQSWDTLHEGIDLDVIWYGDVQTAREGNLKGLEFTRPWLLMIDRWNGSGETLRTYQGVHLFTTPGEITRLDAKSAGYNWQTIAGAVESTYSPEYVEVRDNKEPTA